MNYVQLPDSFELAFKFQGDPVMKASINGNACHRCVLDTGAAKTVLRVPVGSENYEFTAGPIEIESLIIGSVEFLGVPAEVRPVEGLSKIELYLGTAQLRTHCLTLDYANQLARFDTESYSNNRQGSWSDISFIDGRPTVSAEMLGSTYNLILDTGSDGNWIFYPFQCATLLAGGIRAVESMVAECGLGNIDVRSSLTVENVSLGGATAGLLKFLLASESDFGGPGHVSGAGILGTGQVASWHRGLQIIDFTTNRFYLA